MEWNLFAPNPSNRLHADVLIGKLEDELVGRNSGGAIPKNNWENNIKTCFNNIL